MHVCFFLKGVLAISKKAKKAHAKQIIRLQSEAKQHDDHVLLVRNYTSEQHLRFPEQLNVYFLEIKNTEIREFIFFITQQQIPEPRLPP